MHLRHEKTAVQEGRDVFTGVAATTAGLFCIFAAFLWFGHPHMTGWFFAMAAVVCAVLLSAAACYLIANVRAGGSFVCELTDKEIRCHCPIPSAGDSFRLPLAKIEKIERDKQQGEPANWYLWDFSGRRYWLTTNYDNPADEFMERIQQLNPKVVLVDSHSLRQHDKLNQAQ